MKTFNTFHSTVDLFRAHVLNHSSAAERIGNTELALKICNIKIAKNKSNITSLEKTIDKTKKLIDKKDIKTDDSNSGIQQIDTTHDAKSKINHAELDSLYSLACKLDSKKNELNSKIERLKNKQVSLQSKIDKQNCPNIKFFENTLLTAPETHLQIEGLLRLSPSLTTYGTIPASELCSMYDTDKSAECFIAVGHRYKKELQNVVKSYSDDKQQLLTRALERSITDSSYTPKINELPEEIVTCIKICQTVAPHSAKNLMPASNLASMMAPNVFANEKITIPSGLSASEMASYVGDIVKAHVPVFQKWIENVQIK